MKRKEMFAAILSAGIVSGFIIGLVDFFSIVLENEYFRFRMFRTSALCFQESINRWIITGAISVAVLGFICQILSHLSRPRFIKKVRDHIKNRFSVLGKLLANNFIWMSSVIILLVATVNIGVWVDRNFFGAKGPNIILITIDTARADHMPCYGYSKATTPNICDLAKEGFLFEKAITQSSWTKPSMASLFSSTYPHNHKANRVPDVLPEKVLTISEVLKENGYFTIGIQSNIFLKKDLTLTRDLMSTISLNLLQKMW